MQTANINKSEDNQLDIENLTLEENLKEKIDKYLDKCEKLEKEIIIRKKEIELLNLEIKMIKDKKNNQDDINKVNNILEEINKIKKENIYYEK